MGFEPMCWLSPLREPKSGAIGLLKNQDNSPRLPKRLKLHMELRYF
jgi:hypothetical protein